MWCGSERRRRPTSVLYTLAVEPEASLPVNLLNLADSGDDDDGDSISLTPLRRIFRRRRMHIYTAKPTPRARITKMAANPAINPSDDLGGVLSDDVPSATSANDGSDPELCVLSAAAWF